VIEAFYKKRIVIVSFHVKDSQAKGDMNYFALMPKVINIEGEIFCVSS
jgi:hypothetical protein